MAEAFTWGPGGEAETTSSRARRRLAEALLVQGTDASPIKSPWQGLARVAQAMMGGYQLGEEDRRDKQQEAAAGEIIASHPAFAGLGSATPSVSPAVARVAAALPGSSANLAPDRIYGNDEPSPLDPPVGRDRDLAIRTVVGEAADQGPTGMNAVASVIRNRAVNGGYGGDTPTGVVLAPNQFEPWNGGPARDRMLALAPESPAYVAAGRAVDAAYAGNDPTNGAVNFIQPALQTKLGRPMPTWAQQPGVMIGDHKFIGGKPVDPAAAPYEVAGPAVAAPAAAAATAPAMAVAGQGSPVGPAASQMPPTVADWVRRAIRNPATRAAGIQVLSQYTKPHDAELKVIGESADGSKQFGWVDPRTRSVTPYTAPSAAMPSDSVIPAAPSGLDPKIWRKEQSERYTRGQLPASYEDAAKLRGEVQSLPSYKNLAQAAPVYRSMVDAAGRDDRGSDVNLIYGFAKVMDPGSVVRESEMTVAQAIATLPEQLKQNIQSQLSGGGRLSGDVRAAIMREARSRLGAYRGMFDQDAAMYHGIATRNRANPDDIIPSFGDFPEWLPPAPAAAAAPGQTTAPATHVWDPVKGLIRK